MSSTAVAIHEHQGLTLAPDQTEFTEMQVSILTQLGVSGASRGDMAVFHHVCQRTGLDPFARQIHMIGRNTKDENDRWVKKFTIQTAIDGFRLIARRAVDKARESLEYEDNLWCGPDGQWLDVWLADEPPVAAKVVVLRNSKRYPAIAKWSEYVQTKKNGDPVQMWARMSSNQLAKCAEAAALRKAFPQDLGGIYTDDELAHDTEPRGRITATVEPRSAADRVREMAADPEPETAPPADEPEEEASAAARGMMFAQFADLGIGSEEDAEVQRNYIADVLKRPITTRAGLTAFDVHQVIEAQKVDLAQMQPSQ